MLNRKLCVILIVPALVLLVSLSSPLFAREEPTSVPAAALALGANSKLYLPLVSASGAGAAPSGSATPTPAPVSGPPPTTKDPVIAAAGDIACDPAVSSFKGGNGTASACRQLYVSNLLAAINPTAVLTLGDTQYETGTFTAFQKSYDPSWGRWKSITRPIVGNHEYLTADASGYYAYFGAAAGDPRKGYYSYDLGAWHLIALNSQCGSIGGCGPGSPQETWLKADLAAHPNKCTLAYWHIPIWSSGGRANPGMTAITNDLVKARVEVVLTGHDHIYERFALQNASGAADPNGIREFVVGTGGANHTNIVSVAKNSEVRDETTFGVLKMTLHPTSYEWKFVPEPDKTFTDSGVEACR